ncbi:MAG: 16S rRNA (guanine(527)-N(7))-methyltransferase RsmG [Actinobacteria bacterium]|nr:16S rRNA (guanine(527)-N(7))-methyltransferase RsmG [Actinomycetota bacterium]NBY15953.1 16S rRNA (guanine(527)-N(7))-methyltransferase RsmG [Actinomycetota bacterium]
MKHQNLLDQYPAVAQQLSSYAHWLETEGVIRGLIGPREVDRIWDRHLANCAAVAELIPARAKVIDIGSGAGLPGLVLAIIRPDCAVTLVEPLLRRSEFLQEVASDLGLANVAVLRARAEQVTEQAQVVTARAVAPLAKLLGLAMPLVAPGGELLAMKGSNAAGEIEQAAEELKGLYAQICQAGQGLVYPPTTVVRVVRN